jgi:hypothetical protein
MAERRFEQHEIPTWLRVMPIYATQERQRGGVSISIIDNINPASINEFDGNVRFENRVAEITTQGRRRSMGLVQGHVEAVYDSHQSESSFIIHSDGRVIYKFSPLLTDESEGSVQQILQAPDPAIEAYRINNELNPVLISFFSDYVKVENRVGEIMIHGMRQDILFGDEGMEASYEHNSASSSFFLSRNGGIIFAFQPL